MKKVIVIIVIIISIVSCSRASANEAFIEAEYYGRLEYENDLLKELTDILIGISEQLNEEPVSAGPL